MLFNSIEFIFAFLPISILLFFAIAKTQKVTLAKFFLVVSSLLFYSYWSINYLPLLIISIIFNYFMGGIIYRSILEKKRRYLLALGVSVNLLLLGYFKYTNFLIDSLNIFLYTGISNSSIILPLGISFYTFTQIAYLVDSYYRDSEDYSIVDYSLFTTFFPHLIAGPILYHKDVIPQFKNINNYTICFKNLSLGLLFFLFGLFKKVIIADNLSQWVRPVFENTYNVTIIEAWAGALSYTLQIYYDFSGYTDMAIGIGLMLNIQLPINFDSPYKACSIIDFWKKWHMTLSFFLKKYLYIPLGGNRNGYAIQIKNLFITMLLGGLWHGAGWTYIIWGGLHGLYLAINHTWRRCGLGLPKYIAHTLTLLSVICAWVFFRADTVSDAFYILQTMFGYGHIILPEFFPTLEIFQYRATPYLIQGKKEVIGIIALLFFVLVVPNTQQILNRFKPNLFWSLVTILLFVYCSLHLNKVSEFLYFQF